MSLKINKSLQKLLLIPLLLFNLISSCSSINFNRVGTDISKSYKPSKDTSELIKLEDNTLVFINGSKIFLDLPTKFNVLHNDGNLTSFDLKCPFDDKCALRFWFPLISNYMLIIYSKGESLVNHLLMKHFSCMEQLHDRMVKLYMKIYQ